MKKIILSVLMIALGLLFASCASDISEPQISSNPVSPTMNTVVMAGAFTVNYADSLITFSWSAADFGFQSSTTYIIQLSDASSFSGNVATSFVTTQSLSATAKVGDVNTQLLAWNHAIGTAVNVYYRIAASVNTSVATVYSDAKSTSLTPYDAVISYPMVYVPGDYQGWSPGAANGRLYSYSFNSQYSSIIRFNNAGGTSQFKIAPAANWNTSWGGTLTPSGNNYSGTLSTSGGNIQVNNACYRVDVDVNALTIALTKTNDWGLIGSAVPGSGWNSDTNMVYNGQRKMWEITIDLLAGDIKFRADDDWTLNYGGSNGTLSAGGSNITLATAGNYTIRFDPVTLKYTINKN